MFSRFFPSSNGTHGSSPDVSKEKRAFFKEDHMKAIKHTLLLVTVAVAGLSFIGLGSAHAGVIISDTFSGTSGSYMNGRTPDTTDVSGAKWASVGSTTTWEDDIQSNQAKLGADVGDGIALNNISTVYNLSDSFNLANNTYDSTQWFAAAEGTGLGFYSALVATAHSYTDFAGLAVNRNGGVTLFTASDTSVLTVLATTTVAGFNAANNHTLSYSVNTTTGAISNILLDGGLVALTGNPFTSANTAYAGIYSCQPVGGDYTTFQNFAVSTNAVPEPASLTLLGIGALGLLMIKRSRTA